jgi:hypothetical protein
VVLNICNPSTERQEDQKFKIILCYMTRQFSSINGTNKNETLHIRPHGKSLAGGGGMELRKSTSLSGSESWMSVNLSHQSRLPSQCPHREMAERMLRTTALVLLSPGGRPVVPKLQDIAVTW